MVEIIVGQEMYGVSKYGNIQIKKVVRLTKTQIVLDGDVKLKRIGFFNFFNKDFKMYDLVDNKYSSCHYYAVYDEKARIRLAIEAEEKRIETNKNDFMKSMKPIFTYDGSKELYDLLSSNEDNSLQIKTILKEKFNL